MPRIELPVVAPSLFLCYRRADEPYAAALTASILDDLVGPAEVFLDTLYLRQRGPFEDALLDAVRRCRIVLAVIGPAWDTPANLARLADEDDWVRRELREAAAARIPIVPVLVGRDTVPAPCGLGVVFDPRCLMIDPSEPDRLEGDLCRLLGLTRLATPGGRARVERAALALLRHVLPPPQRSMANDRTVARCVAAELQPGDWLRFVTTGNLPRRANGSAVLHLTRDVMGVAQLTPDLGSHPVVRLPVAGLTTDRTDRRRLWRHVSDLVLTSGGRTVRVEGIFGAEADELVELLDR